MSQDTHERPTPGRHRTTSPDAETQVCNGPCERELSLARFPPNDQYRNGRAGTCYDCRRDYESNRRRQWYARPLRERIRKSLDKITNADRRVVVYFNTHKILSTATEGTITFGRVMERTTAPSFVGVYDYRVKAEDFEADVYAVARAIKAPGVDTPE